VADILKNLKEKYLVLFDGNGAEGTATAMQVLPGPKPTSLKNNGFSRPGYIFRGWNTKPDGSGKTFQNRAPVDGNATKGQLKLYAIWEPELTKKPLTGKPILHMVPSQNPSLFVSAQGFCLASNGKNAYAACCFVRNTPKYNAGDDSDYNSSVVLYQVKTGKMVAHADKLPLDHANSMCYDPKKQRFYICTLGNARKPGYIYELDWHMKVTNKILPKKATHVGAMAWYKDQYIGLLPVGHGKYTFVTMDSNFQVLNQTGIIHGYDANYISQGIAVDDKYIYNVACDFDDSHWEKHQRVHVYDKATGKRRGMQTLAIPHEIEDLDIFGGKMYCNTNRQTACDVYLLSGK